MPEFDKLPIEQIANLLEQRVKTEVAPKLDLAVKNDKGAYFKDGVVTRDEVVEKATQLAAKNPATTNAILPVGMLAGDGIKYEDLAKAYKEAFVAAANALDANKDGNLSKAELQNGAKEKPTAEQLKGLGDVAVLNIEATANLPQIQTQEMDLYKLLNSLNTDGVKGLSPNELMAGAPKSAEEGKAK